MLVHTSPHVIARERVAALINGWVDVKRVEIADRASALGRRIQEMWIAERLRVPKQITDAPYIDVDQIFEHLPAILRKLEYPVENGASTDRIDYSGHPKTYIVLALKPLRNQFSSTLSAWVLRGIRNIGCQIAALEVDFKLNFGPETGRSGQISRFGDDSTHLAPGACGQS